MMELLSANWWLIVLALVIGIAVAWWIFVVNRKTRVITTKPDVLDEGAAPAKRNQALIDAPSAAEKPGSVLGATPKPKPAPEPVPAPVAKAAPKAAPKVKAPPAPKAEPKPTTKAAPKVTAKAAAPAKVAAKPAPTPKAKAEPKPAAAPKAKAAPKPSTAKPKVAPKAKEAPKPAATPKAAPKPKAAAKPAAKLSAGPDELIKIKGIGPKLDKQFKELGITSFAQIAAWTDADIDRIDPQLGTFSGRIRRDAFVEQAKLLAAGDVAGFEAKFGAL